MSSGWSVVLPDSLSGKTQMQSASVRDQVCLSRICPDVDTRAYPDQHAASVVRAVSSANRDAAARARRDATSARSSAT